MTIPFYMFFIFIGHFFWAKTRMKAYVSSEGMRVGSADAGGMGLHMFAKDGEMLVSDPAILCPFGSGIGV